MSVLVRLTLYGLVSAIDADLRSLVRSELGVARVPDTIFPSDVLERITERAAREGEADQDSLYEYLDFADSTKTLNAFRTELSPALASFLREHTALLERLVPIRNRVMHSRPLQFTDYSTVDDFARVACRSAAHFFPRLVEFDNKIRANPNFVYSLDLSQLDNQPPRIKHNLPLPDFDETGFLGREQELRDILAACKGSWPVITVVGEGGLGKTALALRAAYELLDDQDADFDAIVWTTAKRTKLTLNDIEEIDGAISSSLGLIQSASSELGGLTNPELAVDEVASYLNSFKILLILDNLETVVDPLLRDFIRKSTGKSKILATSRLGIGEMSFPFPLSGLSANESVQLLRASAKVRRVESLYKAKSDTLHKYVARMKSNPGFIKWFVSCVQCGKSPEQVLANPKIFLDFCLSNVYEHLSRNAKIACKAMLSVPGRQSMALVSYLTELSGDPLQTALAELQSANMIRMTHAVTEAGSETVFELGELPRLYLLRNHPPTGPEDAFFKSRKRLVTKEFERLQAEGSRDSYNPMTVACRNQGDAICAKLLSDAMTYTYKRDYDRAFERLERARELDPSFHEVYRVEAWVQLHSGNPIGAAEAYRAAIELEPRSAPLRFWFGGFLLRVQDDAEGAAEQLLVAEKIDPDAMAVLVELGRAELYLGKFDEADKRLEKVFRSDRASGKQTRVAYDTWLQVVLRRAMGYAASGDYPDALTCCRTVYERFQQVPSDVLDEKIYQTLRRTLTILGNLIDRLALSSLLPEARSLFDEIALVSPSGVHRRKDISNPNDAALGKQFRGEIISVNLSKRFGFIGYEGGSVFFHFSQFPDAITQARKGNVVSFVFAQIDGRYCATDLALDNRPGLEKDLQGRSTLSGHVKLVIPEKGYGFITDDNGRDIFVHRSNVGAGFHLEELRAGQQVVFRLARNHQGVIADQVRPVEVNI